MEDTRSHSYRYRTVVGDGRAAAGPGIGAADDLGGRPPTVTEQPPLRLDPSCTTSLDPVVPVVCSTLHALGPAQAGSSDGTH